MNKKRIIDSISFSDESEDIESIQKNNRLMRQKISLTNPKYHFKNKKTNIDDSKLSL